MWRPFDSELVDHQADREESYNWTNAYWNARFNIKEASTCKNGFVYHSDSFDSREQSIYQHISCECQEYFFAVTKIYKSVLTGYTCVWQT